MDALIHGFATGGLDGLQPVIRHAAQDLHHLPIAVITALQLAPDRGHGGWEMISFKHRNPDIRLRKKGFDATE